MNKSDLNSRRSTSGFNLSIGTGLAMESLFMPTMEVYDSEREVVKIDVKDYQHHFISVFLLVRNIISSFDASDRDEIMSNPKRSTIIYDILEKEIEILDELYSTIDMKAVLWIPNYKELKKNILEKEYTGNISKKDEVFLFTSEVVRYLEKDIGNKTIPLDVYSNKHLLPKLSTKNLISTHIAPDLLNINNIPNMSLLESNTGKLINKKEFNKKYHAVGKADLKRLPFTEYLLYIMGDDNFIKTEHIKVRKEILALAEKHRWNPTTSNGVIKNALSNLPSIRDRVRKFTKIY